MFFVSRRRYDMDLGAARAEADRLRAERDEALAEREEFRTAASTGARQFAQADAAVHRLVGHVAALKRKLRIADAAAGIDHERARDVGERLATVHDAAARARKTPAATTVGEA